MKYGALSVCSLLSVFSAHDHDWSAASEPSPYMYAFTALDETILDYVFVLITCVLLSIILTAIVVVTQSWIDVSYRG